MLSVPTLWTAFVINFFTMGMIWAYVVRSYPKLEAARFWTASALVAGLGAGIATLRVIVDSLAPFVASGTVLIFAVCLACLPWIKKEGAMAGVVLNPATPVSVLEDVLEVEQGSLYPALHRPEDRGWVSSYWGTSENNRKAKFYRLTTAGRRALAAALFT